MSDVFDRIPPVPGLVEQFKPRLKYLLIDEWLAEWPDLRRMFALWIRATLMRKAEYRIVLPRIDDLQELNVMLAERLEEWAHADKAEGEGRR